MAGENDDLIDVDIGELEAKPEGDIEIVTEEAKPDAKVGSPDEEIAALKANVAAERQRAEAAERRASEASQIATRATAETQESNLNLVANAIGTLKMQQETLKTNLAAAMAAGDFDEAADIQIRSGEVSAKLQRLEEGKSALENAPKVQPQQQGDRAEMLAQNMNANGYPQSAKWVREHPEYARDDRLYQRMLAAHNLAQTDGKTPDTPEYFAAVEKTLGIGDGGTTVVQKQEESALSDASQPTGRRAQPAAAPVSRSGTGDGRSRPGSVTLNREEREMADMLGQSYEEYGRNKAALIKEGKLTTH